ncbi:hypothetical protein F5Y12DRAFT_721140 [Xylaria sp. FL1777]|nr:hypothetical protein F5Y12DRAFT_721140 [Xylaria sp. FL1777]
MSSHCFNYVGGQLTSYNLNSEPHYFPCGPVNNTNPAVQCCAWGDTCLSGGICSFTHSLGGGSGYYAAACTDKTFQDDACKDLCGDQLRPDVTYLADRSLWACCQSDANGNLDCANPTNETFKLDAPEALPVLFNVPANGFNYTSQSSATSTPTTSSSSTTHKTSSSTTTSSTTSHPTTSGGLSSGAAAGVGVGVAAAVIITAVAAWLAFRRRRRLAATSTGETERPTELDGSDETKSVAPVPKTSPKSYSPYRKSRAQELTGDQVPIELPG